MTASINLSSSTSYGGLGDYISVLTSNFACVDFTLSGSPVGATIVFEGTADNVSWYALPAYQLGSTANAGVTSTSSAGTYNVPCGGSITVRARLTAITSGSFAATALGTNSPTRLVVTNVPASSFTPTANSAGGSITTANTDQAILAANPARRFLLVQNTHATASLTLNLVGVSTATAGTPNLTLSAGQTILLDTMVPVTALHAQSATAGATFSVIEG